MNLEPLQEHSVNKETAALCLTELKKHGDWLPTDNPCFDYCTNAKGYPYKLLFAEAGKFAEVTILVSVTLNKAKEIYQCKNSGILRTKSEGGYFATLDVEEIYFIPLETPSDASITVKGGSAQKFEDGKGFLLTPSSRVFISKDCIFYTTTNQTNRN
jgi:hypothetical protein